MTPQRTKRFTGLQREFNGVEYDSFLGRSFSLDGIERYVSLDLVSGGSSEFEASPLGIPPIFRSLLQDLRDNKKILLYDSPGVSDRAGKPPIFYVPFSIEQLVMLKGLYEVFISVEERPKLVSPFDR
ncbi:MAG: hypothetical protein IIA87_04500 [Nanoarchaeota archaeon]|nr:hypothetical protein [Nanoarchaeota archaeon]